MILARNLGFMRKSTRGTEKESLESQPLDSSAEDSSSLLQLESKDPIVTHRFHSPQFSEEKLFKGNLILDCPVPPKILDRINHVIHPQRDKFTHVRCSVVTCDASSFNEKNFIPRQNIYAKYRETLYLLIIEVEMKKILIWPALSMI